MQRFAHDPGEVDLAAPETFGTAESQERLMSAVFRWLGNQSAEDLRSCGGGTAPRDLSQPSCRNGSRANSEGACRSSPELGPDLPRPPEGGRLFGPSLARESGRLLGPISCQAWPEMSAERPTWPNSDRVSPKLWAGSDQLWAAFAPESGRTRPNLSQFRQNCLPELGRDRPESGRFCADLARTSPHAARNMGRFRCLQRAARANDDHSGTLTGQRSVEEGGEAGREGGVARRCGRLRPRTGRTWTSIGATCGVRCQRAGAGGIGKRW